MEPARDPKPRRVATERRKEQNRAAQRKYREKIKNRLENHDGPERSPPEQKPPEQNVVSMEEQQTPNPIFYDSMRQNIPLDGMEIEIGATFDFDSSHFDDLFPIFDGGSRDSINDMLSPIDNKSPGLADRTREHSIEPGSPMSGHISPLNGQSVSVQERPSAKALPANEPNLQPSWSTNDVALYQSAQKPNKGAGPSTALSKKRILRNKSAEASVRGYQGMAYSQVSLKKSPDMTNILLEARQMLAEEIIKQLRLDDKENQCLVKTTVARGHNIRDVFMRGLQALGGNSAAFTSRSNNSLSLVRIPHLEAFFSIAEILGFHVPEMYDDNMLSPFYNPEAMGMADLSSIKMKFSIHPPHLRPTPAQIRYPHHPWVDLIPFPSFREKALVLAHHIPPKIDLAELKHDLFMVTGMFCWRPAGETGHNQYWDMRSWEAEPWFLKKWAILSGEKSEIWSQTNWWRGLRKLERVSDCMTVA